MMVAFGFLAIAGAAGVQDGGAQCTQEKSLIKDLLSNLARVEEAAGSERSMANSERSIVAARATALGIDVGNVDSQDALQLHSLLAPRGPAQAREIQPEPANVDLAMQSAPSDCHKLRAMLRSRGLNEFMDEIKSCRKAWGLGETRATANHTDESMAHHVHQTLGSMRSELDEAIDSMSEEQVVSETAGEYDPRISLQISGTQTSCDHTVSLKELRTGFTLHFIFIFSTCCFGRSTY